MLCNTKINNYFGVVFPDNDLVGGKACGAAFEKFMAVMKPLIEDLPVDDVG